MARVHYNKRIPIIKNLLYLNFSSGRGWSVSFGPPGTKVNYGLNDHKKTVSFQKGGFRYRKTVSGGQRTAQYQEPIRHHPSDEKIDKMVSKYVKRHYDLSTCVMKALDTDPKLPSAWRHGIQLTSEKGHREIVYFDYHTDTVKMFALDD
ncbi:MAG: DUF4236 domain-containing protein [Sporolactobacillus sp.]